MSFLSTKYQPYQSLLYLLILCAFVVPLYFTTMSVGFLSDDYDWLRFFGQRNRMILFLSDDSSFVPLMVLFYNFLFYVFGNSPLAYHIFLLCLHIINVLLLAILIRRLLLLAGRASAITISYALLGSLLFALLPYQTEAVVWISCIGYVISLTLALGCILVYLIWIQKGNIWNFILCSILLILAFLAKEVTLVLPSILLVFSIIFLLLNKDNNRKVLYRTLISLLASIIIILLYFILRKAFVGKWIGHYGSDIHLNFSYNLVIKGLAAYLAKFFTGYRFLPFTVKQVILHKVAQWIWLSLTITIMVVILVWFRRKIISLVRTRLFQIASLMFLCFIFSLITVLPLELSFLSEIQSDRYGYFPSAFYIITLILILCSVFTRRWTGQIILFFLIIICGLLTISENRKWIGASSLLEKVFYSVEIRAQLYNEFYFFNIPDTYKGAYVMRGCLDDALFVRNIGPSCKFNLISYVSILDDRGEIQIKQTDHCTTISSVDSTITFLPIKSMVKGKGFYYRQLDDRTIEICKTGPIASDICILAFMPDGSAKVIRP